MVSAQLPVLLSRGLWRFFCQPCECGELAIGWGEVLEQGMDQKMTDENQYEIEEKRRALLREAINRRVDTLRDITVDTASDGLKFLTLTHLAGMGGTLSFIGATKAINGSIVAAFCCFFLGATLVGGSYFARYAHFGMLLKHFTDDVTTMYLNPEKMSYRQVNERDRERSKARFDTGLACAIAALLLFIAGGVCGFFGVLGYIK